MSRNAGAAPALFMKVRRESAWKLGEEQVARGKRNDISSDHQIVRPVFAEQLGEILSSFVRTRRESQRWVAADERMASAISWLIVASARLCATATGT